jgi:TRAP-type C4-dicarboxylate transport system permease large subunit
MNATEIIALILAIAIIVKFIMLYAMKPAWFKGWMNKVFNKSGLMTVLMLLIVLVLGYFLLLDLSIVQLFAAGFFGMAVFGMFIVAYPKAYLSLANEALGDKKKMWLASLIMIILALWVLYAIFF